MEEREQPSGDEVELPEERVEDLEPDTEDSSGVSGGRQVYEWWKKVEDG